jgi:hypothetical protein
MQVPTPSLQHEVMIEAVENHTPEVLVIDEIGRELEAQAARTIAERGVQLIGTAHGITLDNLLLNPTLSDLVGGIESVTLSDEEARRRGTQKTVLERRAPPTFDVLIELVDRSAINIHHDVATAVDMLLRGRPMQPEVRRRTETGDIIVEKAPDQLAFDNGRKGRRGVQPDIGRGPRVKEPLPHGVPVLPEDVDEDEWEQFEGTTDPFPASAVYAYGVARNRLIESARRFKLP